MKKPVLVIMAAGMGSRYGGLKQIDPVDEDGHIIMDFSIYDAKQAGFEEVVFIIKRENEESFREAIGDRIAKQMKVSYVFQDLAKIPAGYQIPEGRVKPWGTAHAVLCCKDVVEGPFAVINADDYYGQEAFALIYKQLCENPDDETYRYTMVGYQLMNTLTDNGYVSRGVCELNGAKELVGICERVRIEKKEGGAAFSEDDGQTWTSLSTDATVSMNMWGFNASILEEIEKAFPDFLEEGLKANPMKCEMYLPKVVNDLMNEGKATVRVLESKDKWYGITYKEDKPMVVAAMQQLKADGRYPEHLMD